MSGSGAWIGKVVVEGMRREEKRIQADDAESMVGALPYRAAVAATLD